MRQISMIAGFLLTSLLSFTQTGFNAYVESKHKSDSLSKAKDFMNAALTLSAVLPMADADEINDDRWTLACYWMSANKTDSAFKQLDDIASSDNLTFDFLSDLIGDDDCFLSLHEIKRWKELKDKMVSKAKQIFFAFVKKAAYNLTPPEQYEAALAWTFMNNPDSAFLYLGKIANTKNNTFFVNFQNVDGFSILNTDKRWQPAINAIYRNAAVTFSSRIRSGNWVGPTLDGFDAARAWSLANEKDSAFYYLDKIVNINYNAYSDYRQLINTRAFSLIESDKRWQPIVETVKKHFKPDPCAHTFNGPDIQMTFTIDPSSSFLKSDGKGTYHDGVDKVKSLDQHAYNFLVSGRNRVMISYDKNDLSSRSLTLDLNHPVAGSGSVAKGIIIDRDAAFHTFYKIDAMVNPMLIYNFRETPVGGTFESPRTEIGVHINGDAYTLVLGTWGLGDCNEPYAYGGKINGSGSTLAKITRNSETEYTIVAPEGSIGRLWNTQNMTHPVDMGLFKTGFIIHLSKQ